MKIKYSFTEILEDKKTLINDCVKELFGNKGFKDTKEFEIILKAGMDVGTFYKYYPVKGKTLYGYFPRRKGEIEKTLFEVS